ncbi:YcjX family protein [Enterovirga rhinocerotis]|uniref:YcjX family protein n=1 Tax=Enterovirga rhinocerotis TaxID=1339210 RepID=UPI001FDF39A9|nr:YcjX family protein [Enterovirga rhinocerotis]
MTDLVGGAASAAHSLRSAGQDLFQPALRLGVTGLSRSGKTVFTTALVHHLIRHSPLPAFTPAAEGRIRRARLAPQPDDDVPRFPVEQHLARIVDDRAWPASTNRIAQLRLDIDFERKAGWRSGPSNLTLDIVDYPGEWLLDLALLDQSYAEWSRETIAASRRPTRTRLAAPWLAALAANDPAGPADEDGAARLAESFRAYLLALRAQPEAVVTTPPGRFLMPGDLAGSPALTFAPLDLAQDGPPGSGTLAALMERRYESYKSRVVGPFFRDHFQRIERQIVLVDVLSAIDAGPEALAELETALDRVLLAFNAGRNGFFSRLFSPRADRVLFAATKADHIHHTSHDRLERMLRLLVSRAVRRTEAAGAKVGSVALASVRATRETTVLEGRTTLRAVAGTPEAGERIGDEIFDGEAEAAIFPGELPEDPEAVFHGEVQPGSLRFPRFRPPLVRADAAGRAGLLPHIRLDRALDFLIGDRLS